MGYDENPLVWEGVVPVVDELDGHVGFSWKMGQGAL